MFVNNINKDSNRLEKQISNSINLSRDDFQLTPKRSGKQILNKLIQNVSKNNLTLSSYSYDGGNATRVYDEEKNLKSLTMIKTTIKTTPDEINLNLKIPKQKDEKIDNFTSTLNVQKIKDSECDIKTQKMKIRKNKNLANSNGENEETQKKKRGCINFLLKCFSSKRIVD